jgi:hypothetical protein
MAENTRWKSTHTSGFPSVLIQPRIFIKAENGNTSHLASSDLPAWQLNPVSAVLMKRQHLVRLVRNKLTPRQILFVGMIKMFELLNGTPFCLWKSRVYC